MRRRNTPICHDHTSSKRNMVYRSHKICCCFYVSNQTLCLAYVIAVSLVVLCIISQNDDFTSSIVRNMVKTNTMMDDFKIHPIENIEWKNKINKIDESFADTIFRFVDTPNPGQAIFIMGPDGSICDEYIEDSIPRHITYYMGTCTSDSLGNMLSKLYLEALRAFQRNYTFEVLCDTELDRSIDVSENDFLLPYFTTKLWSMNLSYLANVPDLCVVCSGWPHVCRQGNNYAVPMIRKTLRQAPNNIINLDDMTIHLRCGDILQYGHLQEYGYPPYRIYKEVLKQPLESIGIISTSINPTLARIKDVPFLDSCQLLLQDMREYLSEIFPLARVYIHTNDSVAQSISRMVYSKQVWCNPSTFCVYPAIASMGQSYIVKSSSLYPFVEEIQDEPNIHILDQDFLSMQQIVLNNMTTSDIIHWLRTN
jgi:hypothetical protein